jgi:hypothetical protein
MLLIWGARFCRWIKEKFVGESFWHPSLSNKPRPAWSPLPLPESEIVRYAVQTRLLDETFREVVRQTSEALALEIDRPIMGIDQAGGKDETVVTEFKNLSDFLGIPGLEIQGVVCSRDLGRRVWIIGCVVVDRRKGGLIENSFSTEIRHSDLVQGNGALEDLLMEYLRDKVKEKFVFQEKLVRKIRVVHFRNKSIEKKTLDK